MFKKGVSISILLTMTFSLLVPITLKAKEYNNSEEILNVRTSNIQQIYNVAESNIETTIIKNKELKAKNLRNQIEKEYKCLMSQLHTTNNRKEWIKKYNALLEHKQLNGKKHITNKYSQQDIALMQRCVETEVHGGDFDSKTNVASVILNRVNDKKERFGNTITEVITAKNQFAYSKTNITEETKLAVEFAYMKDTTNNCLWFHSYKKPGKFYGTYQFTDAVGHHFYK